MTPEKLRSMKDWHTTTIWGRKAMKVMSQMGKEARKRLKPWSCTS